MAAMDRAKGMSDKLGLELSRYPVLVKLEDMTNCPKQYLVFAAGSIVLACLLLGFGASFIW